MTANMAVIHKKLNGFLFYNTTCKLFTWLADINSMLKYKFRVNLLTRTPSYYPTRNTDSKYSMLFYQSMNMSTTAVFPCASVTSDFHTATNLLFLW